MKLLNLKFTNEIAGTLHQAYPACILKSQGIYDAYMMQNYMKIVGTLQFGRPDFSFSDGISYMHELENNCILEIKKLPFSFEFVMNSIKEIIIEALNADFYVVLFTDEFFLEGRESFNSWHLFHEILIYGYDNENFYYFAFNERQILSKLKVRIESAVYACKMGTAMAWNEASAIVLIKPKKIYQEIEFSKEEFVNSLYAYKESKIDNKFLTLNNFNEIDSGGIYWGIQCNSLFYEWIKNTGSDDLSILTSAYHWLEHKNCIFNRCSYVSSRWDDKEIKAFARQYSDIILLVNKVKFLFIKHELKPDTNILKRVLSVVEEISIKEEIIFADIF